MAYPRMITKELALMEHSDNGGRVVKGSEQIDYYLNLGWYIIDNPRNRLLPHRVVVRPDVQPERKRRRNRGE